MKRKARVTIVSSNITPTFDIFSQVTVNSWSVCAQHSLIVSWVRVVTSAGADVDIIFHKTAQKINPSVSDQESSVTNISVLHAQFKDEKEVYPGKTSTRAWTLSCWSMRHEILCSNYNISGSSSTSSRIISVIVNFTRRMARTVFLATLSERH
jgi:hypothetical protein